MAQRSFSINAKVGLSKLKMRYF